MVRISADDFAHDLFARFLHLAAAELLLTAAMAAHRADTLRTIFVERRCQRQPCPGGGHRTAFGRAGTLAGAGPATLPRGAPGRAPPRSSSSSSAPRRHARCTGCRHGCAGVVDARAVASGCAGRRTWTPPAGCAARGEGSNGAGASSASTTGSSTLGLSASSRARRFGLEALALQTFQPLQPLATGFLFGALLGFFRIADLRFGERAGGALPSRRRRGIVEHGDGDAASLRRRGQPAGGCARLRFRLARRGGRLASAVRVVITFSSYGRLMRRLRVSTTTDCGATRPMSLADGPLREAGGLQGQRLLASHCRSCRHCYRSFRSSSSGTGYGIVITDPVVQRSKMRCAHRLQPGISTYVHQGT